MECIVCSHAVQPGLSSWHARCRKCAYELARLDSSINDQQAHQLVNEADREVALRALRTENFRVIASRLARLTPAKARRLLDVGSAHGWFLEVARERFEVQGIEPDRQLFDYARARNLPVRQGFFPEALEQDERFDVIVFNDVIEHIPDIAGALRACHARLNEEGLLVLNLPSSRGFFYRLSKLFARLGWRGPFDRMWQKDLPSPHVHYFNERNLTELVGRHGFEPADSFTLPALRLSGLKQRLRFAGKVNPLALYAQYVAVLALVPALRLLPSDIAVCVFRKGGNQATRAAGT